MPVTPRAKRTRRSLPPTESPTTLAIRPEVVSDPAPPRVGEGGGLDGGIINLEEDGGDEKAEEGEEKTMVDVVEGGRYVFFKAKGQRGGVSEERVDTVEEERDERSRFRGRPKKW